MTALLNLFTQKIVVSRLVATTNRKSIFSTVTAEYVSIHRINDMEVMKIGDSGAVGKTYRLYAEENADILKGDRLVDSSGIEYKVESVTIPSVLGNFVHKECRIVRVKDY